MKKKGRLDLHVVLANPRYRGKHLVIVAGHVFSANSGAAAAHLFDRATRRFPGDKPTLVYVPKADALVLCH